MEEAITRADRGIETAPVSSRNAIANRLPILLNIDFGARNINLCLLNSILGRMPAGSNLVAGATLEAEIRLEKLPSLWNQVS